MLLEYRGNANLIPDLEVLLNWGGRQQKTACKQQHLLFCTVGSIAGKLVKNSDTWLPPQIMRIGIYWVWPRHLYSMTHDSIGRITELPASQLPNTVLSTAVTRSYVKSSDLVHLIAKSFRLFTNTSLFPSLSPWQPFLHSVSSLFVF